MLQGEFNIGNNILRKGALLGLREFLSTKSPLKLKRNAFYFTLKALFVLKIINFLPWLFKQSITQATKKLEFGNWTTKTAVIKAIHCKKVPWFYLISWCGNFVEGHSFRIVLGDSPETMRKLCFSTEFPQQEIRWNYGIFHSDTNIKKHI